MKKFKYISAILMSCVTLTFAQQTPASAQTEAFTIVGATAHIGDGTVIDQSVIVVENGKITACVNQLTSKLAYKGTIIDAKGKHVYPGFISANSSLGLVEVNAVRASNDQRETGNIIPHIRSLIAYNAESKVVESMRPNGVLIGQISPKGGRISGTSSIVQFDAWNWEDAAIKVDDGVYINWPRQYLWSRVTQSRNLNADYAKQIEELNAFIRNSKAYLKGSKATKNLPYEAMQGLFNGSQKLYIRVGNEKGIIDALFFAKHNNIANLVIVGGYDAYKVTDLLKQNNVSVLIHHTHRLPNSNDDDYDLPYKSPKLLMDAGVLVGIHTGAVSNFQTRNLPFYAGQVVGQGMDKENALKLITSNTAKILGIDADYGTLETGKSATIFISEGDALDMRTNILSHAFIDGREISLESHQTTLWKRYNNKYKGE